MSALQRNRYLSEFTTRLQYSTSPSYVHLKTFFCPSQICAVYDPSLNAQNKQTGLILSCFLHICLTTFHLLLFGHAANYTFSLVLLLRFPVHALSIAKPTLIHLQSLDCITTARQILYVRSVQFLHVQMKRFGIITTLTTDR